MGRFNNIWTHIDTDTINNTRNYTKSFIWAIQKHSDANQVVKIEDDVGRVVLSLLGV